jgi:glucokinase
VIDVFPSRKYESLDAIVREFVATHTPRLRSACFGVAGPVKYGRVEAPNLAWLVEAGQLAHELGLKNVVLINDLEANAYGIAMLAAEDFVVLNAGAPVANGNLALIAAGTGLGEAGLHWEGDHYQPFPSEGGHVDFAPRHALEVELLCYLLQQYEHVSY